MKKLPVGIYTFSDFVKDNYLYIDKTKEIYKLFTGDGKYYFLARPRRFGKSLLVSTLYEIFSGNKELTTGTPTFLINHIKNRRVEINRLERTVLVNL